MPVLKAKTPATPATPKGAVVLNLGDLQADADRLREAAQNDAEAIRQAAREEAQAEARRLHAEARANGEAEGREAGHAAGLEAGRAEAEAAWQQRFAELAAGWESALVGYEAHAVSAAQAAERGVVELALRLAEKVVHGHVAASDGAAVVDQVRAALGLVLNPCKLRVRVSEADHAAGVLASALPDLLARARNADADAVELIPDADIAPGGCVVEHGHGTIDATLDTQLTRLAQLLLGETASAVRSDPGGATSVDPDAPDTAPGATVSPVRSEPEPESAKTTPDAH